MYNSAEIQTTSIRPAAAQPSELSAYTSAIDSNSLFNHGNVVYIQHHGECYLLRRTRNNKLILTK